MPSNRHQAAEPTAGPQHRLSQHHRRVGTVDHQRSTAMGCLEPRGAGLPAGSTTHSRHRHGHEADSTSQHREHGCAGWQHESADPEESANSCTTRLPAKLRQSRVCWAGDRHATPLPRRIRVTRPDQALDGNRRRWGEGLIIPRHLKIFQFAGPNREPASCRQQAQDFAVCTAARPERVQHSWNTGSRALLCQGWQSRARRQGAWTRFCRECRRREATHRPTGSAQLHL